jgi:DNA-binding CsgD family transcriptional regulator
MSTSLNQEADGHDQRPGRSTAPLGRDGELARIRSFLDRAATDGGALLLFGEAGVGKTVLLNAAADLASLDGTRVLRAGGVEFEADLPFSALHQVLLPLLAELEQLTATQRDALHIALGFIDGDAPNRLVVSGAALMLLRQAALDTPILVAIDDLPWLDRASAGVIAFVARRLATTRIGLLAASRSEEETLFERAGLSELRVGPLPDEAARLLLGERFPNLTERVVRRILAEARGNPLALLELPLALSRTVPSELPSTSDLAPVGQRMQSLFAERVADLPESTGELLLRVALDGTGDLRVVRSFGQSALEDLAEAERAGLLQVDRRTHRLVFPHPLMRSAVVELASEDERRRAHAALAEILVEQPERRAWHLGEATVEPDASVAVLLEAAGRVFLRRGDAVAAVAALTRASELSPGASDRSRRLAQAAYIGAEATGDLDAASRLLADARAVDPDSNSSLLAAAAAAYVLLNGEVDVDTAHRLLVGAIKNYGETYDPDDPAIVEALYTLVHVCRLGSRDVLWQPLRAAMKRFDPSPPMALRLFVAFADPARTPELPVVDLSAALATLRTESDPSLITRLAVTATYADRVAECQEALQRVVLDARSGGAGASGAIALSLLARIRFLAGDWTSAFRMLEDEISLCQSHGYRLTGWHARCLFGMLAAARGDYVTADAMADEMSGVAASQGAGFLRFYASQVRSLAALGRGEFEAAYQHAASISTTDTHPRYWPLLDVVEAAVRTDRHEAAGEWLTQADAANFAGLSSRTALIAAGAAAVACPDARAIEMFEHALSAPEADRWPFEYARIELAFGERLRRAQAPGESRPHLRTALQTFERLEARPWAERAGEELRAAGESRVRRAGLDRDALTPQELQIATLAASGLTNKQIGERLFLSHKTVAFHLHRVFPKLGVASRAALRDALAALRLAERDELQPVKAGSADERHHRKDEHL